MTYPGPTLFSGHPFTNVQAARYWTSTTAWDTELPYPSVWIVEFGSGSAGNLEKDPALALPPGVTVNVSSWCVRGGYGHDTAVHKHE